MDYREDYYEGRQSKRFRRMVYLWRITLFLGMFLSGLILTSEETQRYLLSYGLFEKAIILAGFLGCILLYVGSVKNGILDMLWCEQERRKRDANEQPD